MPIVDLGVDYTDVQDMDKFLVVPTGTYQFTIKSVQHTKTGPNSKNPGRPMLKWTIEVADPDGSGNANVFYNTPLPYMTNEGVNVDGTGLLVSVCKAVGMPWTGGQLNTDLYIGRSGQVEIKQKPRQIKGPDGTYIDDPDGEKQNEVKKFVY